MGWIMCEPCQVTWFGGRGGPCWVCAKKTYTQRGPNIGQAQTYPGWIVPAQWSNSSDAEVQRRWVTDPADPETLVRELYMIRRSV